MLHIEHYEICGKYNKNGNHFFDYTEVRHLWAFQGWVQMNPPFSVQRVHLV